MRILFTLVKLLVWAWVSVTAVIILPFFLVRVAAHLLHARPVERFFYRVEDAMLEMDAWVVEALMPKMFVRMYFEEMRGADNDQ